jgi:hypothetical protein
MQAPMDMHWGSSEENTAIFATQLNGWTSYTQAHINVSYSFV